MDWRNLNVDVESRRLLPIMDREVEKYYEDYRDMFLSSAWKELIAELKDEGEATDNITEITTVEELHYARGKLSVIARIINMPAALDAAFEQIKEDERN